MSDTNTYRIERVTDFLKVPHGRLPMCLEEFADYLGLACDLIKLTDAVSGGTATAEIGPFIWVDDGKRNKTITIVPMTAEPLGGSPTGATGGKEGGGV